MDKRISILAFIILCFCSLSAQTPREKYEAFKNESKSQYEDFRKKVNARYADFLKRSWKWYHASPAEPLPEDQKIPPVIFNDNKDNRNKKVRNESIEDDDKLNYKIKVRHDKNKKPIVVADTSSHHRSEDEYEIIYAKPINIPAPAPQPKPIAPIKNHENDSGIICDINFYSTPISIRKVDSKELQFSVVTENLMSEAWNILNNINGVDNLIRDCLEARIRYQMNDWAYLEFLDRVAQTHFGARNKSSVFLMAYLFAQSGYQMRLAKNQSDLVLLYASEYNIFNTSYFNVDGIKYYTYKNDSDDLQICNVSFPSERPLSLISEKELLLDNNPSPSRTLKSKNVDFMTFSISENKNLMDFYSTYPVSMIGDNIVTRWAVYASVPISKHTRDSFYAKMSSLLSGKTDFEKVSLILEWMQTAFVYEYDNIVWGHDRAFFPDETLFYPYADCEDRAILFSKLVRDLVGLDVALVFYPGHLAAAVEFKEQISGDCVKIGQRRFVIADPTYIGAPVGVQMEDLDYSQIQAFILSAR